MKKLLTLTVILISVNIFAQCDIDTIPPTFTVPEYAFLDTIYPSYEDIPSYEILQDEIYQTLEDNCLSPDVAPWYGPTLVSTQFYEQTDTSITHRFYAYDDGINYSPVSYVTFFYYNISLSIPEIKDNALEGSYGVYDLNGKRYTEPLKKGFYLKVYENKTEKIIVQ